MSDSRLSGGKCWDYGPKIFGIGRSDAVMSFAGDTAWTYPLIAQVTSYVESFVNLRERAIDFIDAQKAIIRMLNESLRFVSDAADPSLEIPDCSFIFAGTGQGDGDRTRGRCLIVEQGASVMSFFCSFSRAATN